MESFVQDMKYSLRQLVVRPTFTIVAVTVLALGIGAATAIFSVVDTLVIRALPYDDAQRIVTIWDHDLENGIERDDVAPGNFFAWKEQAESFEAMGALDPYSLDLTGDERPEVIFAARVTEGFFESLGSRTIHGRALAPEDFEAGGVVVIGERLWERRFGSDPDIVGQAIVLDGAPTTVVGIVPRSFNPHLSPTVQEREAWIPLIAQGWEPQVRGSRWWNVVAKLAPGVTLADARAEMSTIAGRLGQDYPETNARYSASVVPLRDHLVGNAKTALVVLQGAVLFLLLVACANVASLLLARGTERESEFALRAALGAGRGRLVRQLLTESAAIAIAGSIAGVLLAYWALDLIVAIGPSEIPRLDEVVLDTRILWFALGATAFTAFAFGIFPSLHFSRPDLQTSIKEDRGSTAGKVRQRIRGGMVVAEVALSLILVVGAGLLARSFVSLMGVDPGFDEERVAATQVFHYPGNPTPDQTRGFFDEVLETVRALPGVSSAGAVSALPFIEANIAIQNQFNIEGRAAPRPEEAPNAFVAQATEDYFSTMEIPLIAGRTFDERDHATAIPVTVITETLARRHWPNRDPVGERLFLDGVTDADGNAVPWEVVGVVGQVRHDGLDSDPRPELFLPHAQRPTGSMTFVARTSGDPTPLLEQVQEAIWAVEPLQTIYRSATLEQLLSKSVAARRFNLWLLGSFAGLALVLAGVGIYGVVSYMARTRTHEIGVRMALGAGSGDVLREVMSRGAKLTAIGIGLGMAGALGLTSWMSSLLFQTSPRDPLTLVGVAVVLAAIALLAMYVPARRATSVDPSLALRTE
ncbi:MAG: ABC transporter permease [Gemmatimonadetes bacterium]|nr:ABC transporter permease [Gemmatimonadota bacterium]